MEEMTMMNEVTTEETSMEMTPVVETNTEVKAEAENSGINTWAGVGIAVAALAIGGIVAGVKKHNARKAENKVEAEKKPKKHIKFRKPWEITEEESEMIETDYKDVEDTEEE